MAITPSSYMLVDILHCCLLALCQILNVVNGNVIFELTGGCSVTNTYYHVVREMNKNRQLSFDFWMKSGIAKCLTY